MVEETEDDVALKVLHTADWHLGKRVMRLSSVQRDTLSRARFDAVEQLFAVARSEQVDAVLAAGDLFDMPQPEATYWQALLKILRGLDAEFWATRPIVLLPGNHDPIVRSSPWTPEHPFRQGLPDFVHVVDDDDFALPLGEEAIVHARPCRSTSGDVDLAMSLPARAPGDERIRIGLVHGSTFDIEGHQTSFPIDPGAAKARGFDYLAIGDTHSHRRVSPEGHPPVYYPGAPEPSAYREDGGCVALVFFSRAGSPRPPRVRRRKTATWSWREERITDLATLQALVREDLRRTVLKLDLALELDTAGSQRLDELLARLEGDEATHGLAGVLELERRELQIDPRGALDDRADLPPVLRRAAAVLEAKLGSNDPHESAVARAALLHLAKSVRGPETAGEEERS